MMSNEGFFAMDGTTVLLDSLAVASNGAYDDIIVNMLMGTGPWGAVGVTIFFVIKKFIYPAILQYVNSRDAKLEQLIKNIDNMNTFLESNLKKFDNDIQKSHNSHNKIEALVQELIADSGGNLDDSRALNLIAVYVDKQHLHAKAFFNTRVRVNGVQDNYDAIGRKYMDKALQLSGKTNTQLSQYTHNGIPLSHFFTTRGAESYFRHLLNELFSIQCEFAHQDDTNQNRQISDDDIQNGLDRNLSKLMGAFKVWLKAPENNYMLQKNSLNLNIIQNYNPNDGDVEVL
jgi:hypothetical protein